MNDYINKLELEISKLIQKKQNIEKILEIYPDLETRLDRWNKEYFVSKMATPQMTECHIHHNCGCCSDSPVEVKPYIMVDGFKINANPLSVFVGEKDPYKYRDIRYPDWKERLEEAGYSQSIIDRANSYFPKDEDEG